MPVLQWDRLLESSLKRETSLALVVGTPGFHRTDQGLRAFSLPPLEPADLQTILHEVLPPPHEVERVPGCRSFSLTYGPPDVKFRIDCVGDPEPMALFITQ